MISPLIEKISKKTSSLNTIKSTKTKKPKITISIALDNSFNFYYHDNIEALRREGAKIKFFSPISDKEVPICDLIYLGGGFPEILASSLEKNSSMKKSIKNNAENSIRQFMVNVVD